MKLVVVESPGKIKKIQSFLPAGYRVVASYGHVRDLPPKELGIDFEKGKVTPKYVTLAHSKKYTSKLKDAAKGAQEVILATDPDREGEAIAWHVRALLGTRKHEYSRIVFNEITKSAVLAALGKPKAIDQDRVDAQQARRILDRLVGWIISPFCWDIVASGTSAGRVQSVALRMVVEREKEIRDFKAEVSFELAAWLRESGLGLAKAPLNLTVVDKFPPAPEAAFRSKLVALDGKKTPKGFAIDSDALDLHERLYDAQWQVSDVLEKERRSAPPPPFITSTLQQAATNRFRWSPKQTMKVAQSLYEAGLITYMRTDAPAISQDAMSAARAFIQGNMPPEFLPAKPRFYRSKGNAQEAHECIRPTTVAEIPKEIEAAKPADMGKLYRLIWERFVASQMSDARFDDTKVTIEATAPTAKATFEAKGSVLKFKGWMWIGRTNFSTADEQGEEAEGQLPKLVEGQVLDLARLDTRRTETKPPNRYNQASLIRALEKEGIGRPATYAQIMETLLSREYVREEKRNLHATELGESLSDALVEGFTGHFMERSFTRDVETALDKVAEGDVDWQALVIKFRDEIEQHLAKARATVKPRRALSGGGNNVAKTGEALRMPCPLCEKPLLRVAKGRFSSLECSARPECPYRSADLSEEQQVLVEKVGKTLCPKCQGPMAPKVSVKNDQLFLSCLRYPDCTGAASVPGSEGTVSAMQRGAKATRPRKASSRSSSGGATRKPARKKAGRKTGKARSGPSVPASGPSPECPVCSSGMNLRRSAHGPFWGCSKYPNCKGTMDASE